MKRIQTGRCIKVEDFRKLNKCVTCGYAGDDFCRNCIGKVFNKCEICEIILRSQERKVFYYDMYVRGDGNFKLSSKDVKEFYYFIPVLAPIGNETMCCDCANWEHKAKNLCMECGDRIVKGLAIKRPIYKIHKNKCSNSLIEKLKLNYKQFGNNCSACFNKKDYTDEVLL